MNASDAQIGEGVMPFDVTETEVRAILTRTGGYLTGVASHSLQPYRGCSFGRSLCGVGCYVQHNINVTKRRPWGSFLEVRRNAADAYMAQVHRERAWARRRWGRFGIFLSSATDPFLPQETKHQVTRRVLEAMRDEPPDLLILQTHTDRVLESLEPIVALSNRCELRVHLSIETDQDQLPGSPRAASTVEGRLAAAATIRAAGVRTVITVAPLLPIIDPVSFFRLVSEAADAVVIDHYIEGDGSVHGSRTQRTALPFLMERSLTGSTDLAYRDEIVSIARSVMPGRVGVGARGFAGQYA